MKIKLNEVYEYKGMEVEVLKEDINSSGNTVYACMKVDDPKHLMWVGKDDLREALRGLTPLQKDYVNSMKQQFNIIACGSGAGATTALFENIIKEGVDCYIISKHPLEDTLILKDFLNYLNGKEDVTVSTYDRGRGTVVINLVSKGHPKYFTAEISSWYPLTCAVTRHLYDTRSHRVKDFYAKEYLDYLRMNEIERVTFVTKPSDLVSGYSTTTEKGYYEVKTCNSFILALIIHKTGKIPKATPSCIKKFLSEHTNLITGYNYKDNTFLPKDYGLAIESLYEEGRVKCLGNWVKV